MWKDKWAGSEAANQAWTNTRYYWILWYLLWLLIFTFVIIFTVSNSCYGIFWLLFWKENARWSVLAAEARCPMYARSTLTHGRGGLRFKEGCQLTILVIFKEKTAEPREEIWMRLHVIFHVSRFGYLGRRKAVLSTVKGNVFSLSETPWPQWHDLLTFSID